MIYKMQKNACVIQTNKYYRFNNRNTGENVILPHFGNIKCDANFCLHTTCTIFGGLHGG